MNTTAPMERSGAEVPPHVQPHEPLIAQPPMAEVQPAPEPSFASRVLDAVRPSTWAIRGLTAVQARRGGEIDPDSRLGRFRASRVGRLAFDAGAVATIGTVAGAVARARGMDLPGIDFDMPGNHSMAAPEMKLAAHSRPLNPTEEVAANPSPSNTLWGWENAEGDPQRSQSPTGVEKTPDTKKSAATSSPKATASPTPETTGSPKPKATETPAAAPKTTAPNPNVADTTPDAKTGSQRTPGATPEKTTTTTTAGTAGNDPAKDELQFSKGAQRTGRGEGWYHQFNEMKIGKDIQPELLDKIGPELKERGLAYYDNEAGEWRMKRKNPTMDDLKFIHESAESLKEQREVAAKTPDIGEISVHKDDNLAEAVDRNLQPLVADDAIREALVTDLAGNQEFIAALQKEGLIEMKNGQPVLEHGVPLLDLDKFKKDKDGMYILPDNLEAKFRNHLEQYLMREILDQDTPSSNGTNSSNNSSAQTPAPKTSSPAPTTSPSATASPTPTPTPTATNTPSPASTTAAATPAATTAPAASTPAVAPTPTDIANSPSDTSTYGAPETTGAAAPVSQESKDDGVTVGEGLFVMGAAAGTLATVGVARHVVKKRRATNTNASGPSPARTPRVRPMLRRAGGAMGQGFGTAGRVIVRGAKAGYSKLRRQRATTTPATAPAAATTAPQSGNTAPRPAAPQSPNFPPPPAP